MALSTTMTFADLYPGANLETEKIEMNTCDNEKCRGVTENCADCLQIIVDVHQRRIAKLRRESEHERAVEWGGKDAQFLNAIRQISDAIGRLTEAVNRK